MSGRVDVVGLGPGHADWITPETGHILVEATDLVGYGPYLARLIPEDGQTVHASDNRVELDRARHALVLAREGKRVAVVSGGDPGIFAMAAAVMEAIDLDGDPGVPVAVHPGVSALQAVAARLGAPLGHDFAVINLSDNLKDWGHVEARLRAAGQADFVVALFNPASRARPGRIFEAFTLLRAVKPPATIVAFARAVGRPDERITITTLGDADPALADMATLVIVGSTTTRAVPRAGGGRWVYTPRIGATPAETDPNAPWLSIIGIGEDGIAGLSESARRLIAGAELVVGGQRHLDLIGRVVAETRAWPSPMGDLYADIVARRGRPVVVLASGDPVHHGVASVLFEHVAPAETRVLGAPSSFSLAAARLGWAVQDVTTISLHGRALERIVPHLRPGRRILALAWDGTTAAKLAALLNARGLGPSRITVLEAMAGPREKRRVTTAAGFDLPEIDPLNVIALEVAAGSGARIQPLGFGLADDLFEHDGQITKREIRAMTLAALAPVGGEVLWDIGAGSGSIAIEWLLADPLNTAHAVESSPVRSARILRNAIAFGVPGLDALVARAPEGLDGLPDPDAIFVGGGASDTALIDELWRRLKSGGRIVVNAVSLGGEAELIRRATAHGGDLTRIAIERLRPLGSMQGFEPARTVIQWRGVKP